MLRTSLYDYTRAYATVKETMSVSNTGAAAAPNI